MLPRGGSFRRDFRCLLQGQRTIARKVHLSRVGRMPPFAGEPAWIMPDRFGVGGQPIAK